MEVSDSADLAEQKETEWQDIPNEIQSLIVRKLDLTNRLNARYVSHQTRDLIDTSPFKIRLLMITVDDASITWQAKGCSVGGDLKRYYTVSVRSILEVVLTEAQKEYIQPDYQCYQAAAADDIKAVFSNDKLEVEELWIRTVRNHEIIEMNTRVFIRTFVRRLGNQKLSAAKLRISLNQTMPGSTQLMLDSMKEGTLRHFTLNSRDPNHHHDISLLVNTPQWAGLKNFVSNNRINDFRPLFHLQIALSAVPPLNIQQVNDVIEHLLEKRDLKEWRLIFQAANPRALFDGLRATDVQAFPTKDYAMTGINKVLRVTVTDCQVCFNPIDLANVVVP